MNVRSKKGESVKISLVWSFFRISESASLIVCWNKTKRGEETEPPTNYLLFHLFIKTYCIPSMCQALAFFQHFSRATT